MFNVLITKAVNAAPAADLYGEGLALLGGAPDIEELDEGGIALCKSDGQIIQRDAAGDIADSISVSKGDTLKFVVRTANGLQKGLTINPFNFSYNHRAYIAPGTQESKHVISAPADLTPFVGQYATLRVTDNSQPEYKVNRTKSYEVELNDENADDIDSVMAELVDKINNDDNAIITAAYDNGTDTITYTANEAGVRFTVNAEDIIRDSTYTVNAHNVVGTPTSALAEKEIRRSSQLGINIDEEASELYNISRSADKDTTYDVFVINTTNNVGHSKSPNFELTQTIAIPSGCTGVIAELTSLLEYLAGEDNAATWEA